jgi:lipopolysaccharide export system protein LptA
MKTSVAFLCAFLSLVAITRAQSPAPTDPVTPVDTVITAEKADIKSNEAETETYAFFEGNVVVTGTNLRITCDRIDATVAGGKDTVSAPSATTDEKNTASDVEKFKHVLATGKVRIVQGDREANCERAEVFPREGKIILTGNPVVMDHGAQVTWVGERLILLKNERRVMGDNVKVTFPPIKQDLGFDKNAPVPQPENAAP